MEFHQRNEIKFHQSLSIDQSLSLQEQLKILSLPIDELEAYAFELLEANPAVEAVEYPHSFHENKQDAIASNPKEKPLEQIPFQLLSTPDQILAEEILESLSPEGFLQQEEKRRLKELYPESFDSVLQLIQTHSGLGFEDRIDFWIHILSKGTSYPLCLEILKSCKSELLSGNFASILRRFNLSKETFRDKVLKVLKTLPLSPKIVSHPIGCEKVDIAVYAEDETLDFEVFCPMPIFQLSKLTLEGSIEVKEFYKPHLRALRDLTEGFKKRKMTLERLLKIVIPRQKEFLFGETAHPVPIDPNELAETLEVHPSTIARCLQHKTLLSPKGVISLKTLVTPEPKIKDKFKLLQMLKNLIQSEDKSAPYSDEKLQKLLALKGSKVQRRTLSKYRKKLKIPDARRRFFS